MFAMRTHKKAIFKRTDIHEKFGGQGQSGISTPVKFPVIFLFSSDNSIYDNSFDGEYFFYNGETKNGNALMNGGNLAINNHIQNEKSLHLFLKLEGGFYEYFGEMELVETIEQNNNIQFKLKQIHSSQNIFLEEFYSNN